MMLPDRQIHINAQQLQASWDAERDHSRFAQLVANVRAIKQEVGGSWFDLLEGPAIILFFTLVLPGFILIAGALPQ